MKTHYKHIYFKEIPNPGKKTRIFGILNNSQEMIGEVRWYGPWRQYCSYTAAGGIVFDRSCHKDVAHFIQQLMDERKKILAY